MQQFESRTIECEGLRMRWLEHGSGVPVVMVHGIPTSPLLWRKIFSLVPDARLLAWEMVGYGESIDQGVGRELSIAKQAEYLRAWLDALGIERAVLVGHDLGGGVVQRAALAEPERCAGLVLTNAIGYDSWPVAPVLLTAKAGSLVERVPSVLFKPTFEAIVAAGYRDPKIARECLEVHWRPYAKHGGAAPFVRQTRALHTRDTLSIQDQLPSLRGTPARVVWGTDDGFQKLRYGKRFAADLACPLIPIEGGKHFVPDEYPEPLAAAIRDVLAALRESIQRTGV